MITAEVLRAREGKAETWEAETLSDYSAGQPEEADAAPEDRFV